MGYDVTVQRIPRLIESKKVRYDYRYSVEDAATGNNNVFQTIGDPLSEESAYRIVSRATRVWTVRQVALDDEGNPELDDDGNAILSKETYALKDVWLYADARMEKDIQDDIFAKLGDKAGEARPYFLTIMHDSVTRTGCGEDDMTPICPPEQASLAAWTPPDQNLHCSSSAFEPCKAAGPQLDWARKHVRTVFKELCKSVYELPDFRSLVECLLGCVKGMFFIFFVL